MSRRVWKVAAAVGGYLAALVLVVMVALTLIRPVPPAVGLAAVAAAFLIGFGATVLAVLTTPSEPLSPDQRKQADQ